MTSPLRFDGEVVLVTGAGRGLGRAYALTFAQRGARVLVNDLGTDRAGTTHDAEPAAATVEAIKALGGEAIADSSSAADSDGGDQLVEAAMSHWGRLDHVIANAGIWRDHTIVNTRDEDFDQVHDVHLRGSFRLLRAAFRQMKASGGGSVLLTSSTAGLYGVVGQANYASAKAGVVGLMRVAALEGRRHHIRANAIVPLAATRSAGGKGGSRFSDEVEYPLANAAELAVALAHRSCAATGQLVLAGGGWFSRIGVQMSSGWQCHLPTAEEITSNWTAIGDMSASLEFEDGLNVRPLAGPER